MTSSRPTDKEPSGTTTVAPTLKPWPALWALVIGFFMILVDTTIVSVANPSIMEGLNTGINEVIWVTSAYLLAYAVPLLITGRLGDRFGPKNIYLIGLVVFTLSSAWCGLSGDISTLIVARVFQGLGAAMMTPQTMAVITRIFPPDRRGQAMGLWGATAGVATLIGPILGGVLVDTLGWEWIFFINLPVGVVAFVLGWRLIPNLATHRHRFDLFGVVLSAVGMFLVVFGIQEGASYDWGVIVGPISVWSLIIAGIITLIGFVIWQRYNRGEPLVPLKLFRDRNFSLSNGAMSMVGFAITSMALPLMFYFQLVLGLPPTQSALMLAPSAVLSGVLAPFVGRLVDLINPRYVAVPGLFLLAGGLYWYFAVMTADAPIWLLLLPSVVLGLANASVWSPISSTATHNLPPHLAGAGSGVYNTTRQVGAVLGSAAIAALIQSRLAAEIPGRVPEGVLPASMHAGYAAAMGQSLLLPAAAAVLGAIIVMFWEKPKPVSGWGEELAAPANHSAEVPAAPLSESGAAVSPLAENSDAGESSRNREGPAFAG